MSDPARILVVESNQGNMGVLVEKLEGAGFAVHAAARAPEALEYALGEPPDVILLEADLPGMDGLELCRRIRADERTTGCGLILLSRDSTMKAKEDALSAGCDDYLTKPIFVKEVIIRLGKILDKLRKREGASSFRGTLAKLSVPDLLQLMEASRKTCTVNVYSDALRSGGFASPRDTEGMILFNAGRVHDAFVGPLSGALAVYRMLMWKDGDFEIEFAVFDCPDNVKATTQHLLLEGARRLDHWRRFIAVAGPPNVVLAAPGSVPDLEPEVAALLKLLDGKRTLLDAIDELALQDDTILIPRTITLFDTGVIRHAVPAPKEMTNPFASLAAPSPESPPFPSRRPEDTADLGRRVDRALDAMTDDDPTAFADAAHHDRVSSVSTVVSPEGNWGPIPVPPDKDVAVDLWWRKLMKLI